MAATNEVIAAKEGPILLYVYAAVIVLCLLSFRSIAGTLCVLLPLAGVSVLAYALMAVLGIGLETSTLPVAALGVGLGVDYGIYIFNTMFSYLQEGLPLQKAYYQALRRTGKVVLFIGINMAVGVSTWLFSGLQFQADMGLLLIFFFIVNMLGAIFVLPALARFFLWNKAKKARA
jgi:predicted RND superfamily exporter protein